MTRKEQDESFRDVLDAIFAISSKARKDEDSFCCSCTENAAFLTEAEVWDPRNTSITKDIQERI